MDNDKRSLTLRGWFRLITVGLVLIILLAVSRLMWLEWRQLDRAQQGQQAVVRLRLALVAAEMVSRERGPSNSVLGDEVPGGNPVLRDRLRKARMRTDLAFSQFHAVLTEPRSDRPYLHARERAEAYRVALQLARQRVDQLAATPKGERQPTAIREAVQGMVALVPMLTPAVILFADDAHHADPSLATVVWGARRAGELREYAGLLGSLFTPALARQAPFAPEEVAAIHQVKGRIAQLHDLLEARAGMEEPAPAVRAAHERMDQVYFGQGQAFLRQVLDTGYAHGRFGLTPADFAARYVPLMEPIVGLRDALLLEAEQRSAAVQTTSRCTLLVVSMTTAVALFLVLVMLRMAFQRFVRPLSQVSSALHAMSAGDLSQPLPRPQAQDEMAEVIAGAEALRQATQARETLEQERDKLIDTLRAQSATDFLTGLPNRRAFFETAESELARAKRHEFNVVVMLIDVDHFKRVNDTAGHAAGDRVLVAMAQTLRNGMRQGDVVARLGGEEFVALLSYCEPDDAVRFADRLREAVAGQWVDVGDDMPPVRLTISIGLADSNTHGLDINRLLARADDALYAAKHAGRNRTVLAEPPTEA